MYHTYNLPGVDLPSNRNEYQEYFLRSKGGRCVGLTTLRLHVPIVLKSGSLNFLVPSGPFQPCNGFAMPFFTNSLFYVHISS